MLAPLALTLSLMWRLGADHTLTTLRGPSSAIAGAYHVHSARSHDSTTSPARWAAAAAALGLDFVVLTDHNVAPQDAMMMGPVLMLFEGETTLPTGHRVDLPNAALAAHPTDRKRPWTATLDGLAGLEIASVSARARALGGSTMLGLLPLGMMGLVRQEAGLAQLYGRDDGALALWDAAPFPLAGLCGADAHGWLPREQELTLWRMVLPTLPRTRPLRVQDAQQVRAALLGGQSLCVSGMLPQQAHVEIVGITPAGHAITAQQGMLSGAGVAALEVRRHEQVTPKEAPPLLLQLLHDGRVVCTTKQASCRIDRPVSGLYRAELSAAVPRVGWGHRMLPVVYGPRVWLREPDLD